MKTMTLIPAVLCLGLAAPLCGQQGSQEDSSQASEEKPEPKPDKETLLKKFMDQAGAGELGKTRDADRSEHLAQAVNFLQGLNADTRLVIESDLKGNQGVLAEVTVPGKMGDVRLPLYLDSAGNVAVLRYGEPSGASGLRPLVGVPLPTGFFSDPGKAAAGLMSYATGDVPKDATKFTSWDSKALYKASVELSENRAGPVEKAAASALSQRANAAASAAWTAVKTAGLEDRIVQSLADKGKAVAMEKLDFKGENRFVAKLGQGVKKGIEAGTEPGVRRAFNEERPAAVDQAVRSSVRPVADFVRQAIGLKTNGGPAVPPPARPNTGYPVADDILSNTITWRFFKKVE